MEFHLNSENEINVFTTPNELMDLAIQMQEGGELLLPGDSVITNSFKDKKEKYVLNICINQCIKWQK